MKSVNAKLALLVASGLVIAQAGACMPVELITNLFSGLIGTVTGA